MRVIGIFGTIGSGKSAVAGILKKQGAEVLDLDSIGHSLLREDAVKEKIRARFGESVFRGGEISRRELGKVVFSDASKLVLLNKIVHPLIIETVRRSVAELLKDSFVPMIVIEGALLPEMKLQSLCTHLVFVDADRRIRAERLGQRDGWTLDELEKREQAQVPPAQKRRLANTVLANNGSLDELNSEVRKLMEEFK